MSTSCCSNCGCNNGSCGCGCAYIVNLPSEAPEILSFQNINVGGVGVLDSAVQPNINFRGVASANALLTVALDAGNKNVLLTVDAAAIAAALPAATTTAAGILETATDAEAIAKVATNKIVVPSNFAAMGASTSFAGLAEIATQAEVNAGADAVRYVAPDTLGVLLGTKKNTVTFADAVARAALAPAFEGQYGYQLDTNQPYVAYGVAAGNWDVVWVFGQSMSIAAGVSSGLVFGAGATLDIDNGAIGFTGTTVVTDTVTFSMTNNSSLTLTGCVFNLEGSDFQIGGSSVTANRLVGTSAFAGDLAEFPISNFISAYNTQTGYTNFTNSATLRTGDCNTLTLPEICQIVDTLIRDLKAVLLPST